MRLSCHDLIASMAGFPKVGTDKKRR